MDAIADAAKQEEARAALKRFGDLLADNIADLQEKLGDAWGEFEQMRSEGELPGQAALEAVSAHVSDWVKDAAEDEVVVEVVSALKDAKNAGLEILLKLLEMIRGVLEELYGFLRIIALHLPK